MILGDIATAARIESIEKTRFISSTLTTVAQNAERPSHGLAFGGSRRCSVDSPDPQKC